MILDCSAGRKIYMPPINTPMCWRRFGNFVGHCCDYVTVNVMKPPAFGRTSRGVQSNFCAFRVDALWARSAPRLLQVEVESYLDTWSPARWMPAKRQHDSGRVHPLARRDVGECVGPARRL